MAVGDAEIPGWFFSAQEDRNDLSKVNEIAGEMSHCSDCEKVLHMKPIIIPILTYDRISIQIADLQGLKSTA